MQQAPQPRRRHTFTWILALFALLELGALAAVITFRSNACSALGFAPAGGAALRLGGGGGGNDTPGGSGPAPTPTPVPQASAAIALPAASASASGSAANPGDVKTDGDTNQVPDPNCVAKAAADVLTSSPAPAATVSCAPMSPPPALKNAEQQIQSGNVSAPPQP